MIAKSGDIFRPYDLVVVSREQVDAEYFTMSACGIVHVSPFSTCHHAPPLSTCHQVDAEYFTMSACGIVHVFASEQPSEFLPLSTWMQQSTFFNVLTSIRFFKHYLVAKIFRRSSLH